MQDNVYMARSLVRIDFTEQDVTLTAPACVGEVSDLSLFEKPSYLMMFSHLKQLCDDKGSVRFFAHINLNATNLNDLYLDLTKTSISGKYDNTDTLSFEQLNPWQRMIHSLMQ